MTERVMPGLGLRSFYDAGQADWGETLSVVATVNSIVEKAGRNGTVWFANVTLDYRKADGALAVREVTKLVKRS